jgi:hypothetical protein
MADYKLDIEIKIVAKPIAPKVGLESRGPMERNAFTVIDRATRYLYGAAKTDVAPFVTNALKIPTRNWALSTVEPPEALTLAATTITVSAYTLNGSVHPHATSTAISFDHGTDLTMGSNNAAASGTPSALNAFTAFSYTRSSGVTASTQYYFRVKAIQGAITIYGQTLTFRTPAT